MSLRATGLGLCALLLMTVIGVTVVGCDDGRPDRRLASDAAATERVESALPTTLLDSEPEAVAEPDALAPGPQAPADLVHPLLERIVLIGASLTAGFGATLAIDVDDDPSAPPTFVPIALGDALVATMRDDRRPAVAQGDMFFFLRPDTAGTRLTRLAERNEPSLLVALDLLFWFGYGNLAAGETRDARLQRGFALLDRFECPIVVADFPDLSEAVGRMISASQMPAPDELATLNRMLRAWADARGNVAILPLAELVDALRNGGPVTVAGFTWDRDAVDGLLQEDRMHATPAGMLVVVRRLLEEIVAMDPTLGSLDAVALEPDHALTALRRMAVDRIRPR